MITSHKATVTTCWPDGFLVFHCFGYFASDHLMQNLHKCCLFFLCTYYETQSAWLYKKSFQWQHESTHYTKLRNWGSCGVILVIGTTKSSHFGWSLAEGWTVTKKGKMILFNLCTFIQYAQKFNTINTWKESQFLHGTKSNVNWFVTALLKPWKEVWECAKTWCWMIHFDVINRLSWHVQEPITTKNNTAEMTSVYLLVRFFVACYIQ